MRASEMAQFRIDAPPGWFEGIERPYSVADVKKLRGSIPIRYTLADITSKRLWYLLNAEPCVHAPGDVTRKSGDADGSRRCIGSNLQIHQAVEAGVFVELMRAHRVHNGRDQRGEPDGAHHPDPRRFFQGVNDAT